MARPKKEVCKTLNAYNADKKIQAYFIRCETKNKPLTIMGIANALKISKDEVINIDSTKFTKELKDVIRDARNRVAQEYEELLHTSAKNTGAKFALKQLGWDDSSNLKLNNDEKPFKVNIKIID